MICCTLSLFFFFFFNVPPTTEIYTLSLHDALPISLMATVRMGSGNGCRYLVQGLLWIDEAFFEIVRLRTDRSEEHTSELQSRQYLVCRLLLEKKKKHRKHHTFT